MAKLNLEILYFPGFYESWALDSNSDFCAARDFEEDYKDRYGIDLVEDEDYQFNYEKFKGDFSRNFILEFKCLIENSPFNIVSAIDKDGFEIDSPKYYNYRTDKLYADVELVDGWLSILTKFIAENREWFAAKIEKDWSDRPGFWSFMSTDVDEWLAKLAEEDTLYVSNMLGYILEKHYGSDEAVSESLMYSVEVNSSEYYELTESGEAKVSAAEETED